MNRRRLLHATGLSAGALAFPPLMGERAAGALGEAKRVVFFVTQHGPGYENWNMRRTGLPDQSADWEIDLASTPESEWSTVLAPLYPHRSKVLVLDGLCLMSALADNPGTNNHNAGTSHVLTGARMVRSAGYNNEGQGGARSVDQLIADKVAVKGRLHSLYYSSRYKEWPYSFQGPNQPTPAEFSPQNAFERLFPVGSPRPGEEEAQVTRARPKVLDLVRGQYEAVAGRLSGDDKRKLDAHRQLVADLEAQLQSRLDLDMTKCDPPTRPTVVGDESGADVVAVTEPFMRLVTAAMGCDLTRVAVIAAGQFKPSDIGVPEGDVHQDVAHGAKPPGNVQSQAMGRYYRLHAGQFARLIDLFDQAGLLSSTALVWMNDLANGPHDLYRVMVVLAGAAGGAFRPGRYIKYKEDQGNPAQFPYGSGGCGQPMGPAHSRVHIAIMQAMGLSDNALGIKDSPACLYGNTTVKVDLTGPLPRLG